MHKDLLKLAGAERSVRLHLGVCLAAAATAGLLVLVQAELLAGVLSGRFASTALLLLALVVVTRGLLGWLQGTFAVRTAGGLKSALRRRLLARLEELRPGAYRSGELVTLAGRGLDSLDPYLTGYLPAVAVAGVVPIAVLTRLLAADLASAVIVLLTLPLIPIFGALVGWTTKTVTERQWWALTRLGGHFLDVVRGLPTLRAFGRARYQADVIHQVAEAHRVTTMRTLRVAFLSSLVLEFVASLSLALVAVPVGLRLLSDSLDLDTALLVLLLAPEAYLPLRVMGLRFHAAMEGIAAADQAFALIDPPAQARAEHAEAARTGPATPNPDPADPAERPAVDRSGQEPDAHQDGQEPDVDPGGQGPGIDRGGRKPVDGGGRAPDVLAHPGPPEIRLEGITVRYPGRQDPALDNLSLVVAPGEKVAIVGPSGAGKSTLLHLLLGFVEPASGRVLVNGVDLAELDLDEWRRELAFVPQRPHLFATSVADNIALGSGASERQIQAAATAAQAAEFVTALPDGYATRLGERGADLSAGQRQRIALARAFCRPQARVLLLDEPTARLDGRSEAAVIEATRQLCAGRTAIIVAHRPAMIEIADRVIRLDRVTEPAELSLSHPGPDGR